MNLKLEEYLLANGYKEYPTFNPMFTELTRKLFCKQNKEWGINFNLDYSRINVNETECVLINLSIQEELYGKWLKYQFYNLSPQTFIEGSNELEQQLIAAYGSYRILGV